MTTVGSNLNPLKPFAIAGRGEFKISFSKAISKATDSSNAAPKSKHVRRIVLETHQQHSGATVWQELQKRKLTDKLIAWKCANVTHRILLEGHHSVLEEVEAPRQILRTISKNFKNENPTVLITVLLSYVDYILTKLDFHSKFAAQKGTEASRQFAGNFALDEFLRHQPTSQPQPIKFQNYLQHLNLLLELQDNILNFQNLVLRESRSHDIDQNVVWAFIPLIPESYGIYTIITNILKYVINQSDLVSATTVSVSGKQTFKNEDDLFDYFTSRFYSQYISLRDFFFKASNIHAIFSVIPIPTLPAEPPQFVRVQADRGEVKRSKERRRLQQSEKANQESNVPPSPVMGQQTFAPFGQVTPQDPFQIAFPPQQPPFQANTAFNSPFGNTAFFNQPAPAASFTPAGGAPAGWVTFGAKPATAVVQPPPQPVQAFPQTFAQPFTSVLQPQTFAQPQVNAEADSETKTRLTDMENMNVNLIKENAQMKQRLNDLEELLRKNMLESAGLREELDKVRGELVSVRNEVDEERRRRLQAEIEAGVAGIEAALLGLDQLNSDSGNGDTSRLLRTSRGLVENLARLLDTAGFTGISEEEKEAYLRQVLRRAVEQTVEMMGCTKEVGDEIVARAMRDEGKAIIEFLEKIGRTIDSEDDWAKAVSELMSSSYGQNLLRSVESSVNNAVNSLSERQQAASEKRLQLQREEEAQQKLSEEEKTKAAAQREAERKRQMEASGAELESRASQELLNAARIIEEASRRLTEERNKLRAKEAAAGADAGAFSIEGTIMDGAGGITQAVRLLIEAATEAQKEREAEGKGVTNEAMYKEDIAWMEGLISAAKQVAVSTSQLVEAAQAVGTNPEALDTGKLVAASKGVAAAVALLVSAFKAKAKANSKCNDKLVDASGMVRKATNQLVEAARSAGEQEYQRKRQQQQSASGAQQRVMTATEYQVAVLNQRAKIERLQKKLEEGLVTLGGLKQSAYEGAGATGAKGSAGGGEREEQEKARAAQNRQVVHHTLENRFSATGTGEVGQNVDQRRLADQEAARLARHGV